MAIGIDDTFEACHHQLDKKLWKFYVIFKDSKAKFLIKVSIIRWETLALNKQSEKYIRPLRQYLVASYYVPLLMELQKSFQKLWGNEAFCPLNQWKSDLKTLNVYPNTV